MRHLSSLLGGFVKSLQSSDKRSKSSSIDDGGKDTVKTITSEGTKKAIVLRSSGTVSCEASDCFVSVYSRRGEKGVNQDCTIVWERFGCQENMIFCGVFDGHGHWGHYVSKNVRESLPSSLLSAWKEARCLSCDASRVDDKSEQQFQVWKQSYLRSCDLVDKELEKNRKLDAFHSGSTALTIIKQDEDMIIANVGDSRAVLATKSDDGILVPVQLTTEFRPNLPQESERIIQSNGRIFCLKDEPGVPRLWRPDAELPGLAMSRAFGDHSAKQFGLISVPEVTRRSVTGRDQFIILATDGVWDVISNQEAIDIISSTTDRGKSAKRLVECAVRAWRRKRKNVALDDCSVVCLFFHLSSNIE